MVYDGVGASGRVWPAEGVSRVPAWIYSDPELFQRELERFFFGPCWNYVGLECEVPSNGSFKRSWVATRQVLLTRDPDGGINVIENRCAHRGTPVCWKHGGEGTRLICPYHQWTYDLKGNLKGMPFKSGVMGEGGMPKDFDMAQHGLRKLRTFVRGGVVWASFDDKAPDFETYCGPSVLEYYDRIFNGRPLRLLGYTRSILPNNWKLYSDNVRDAYHASILHAFFVKFGLFRADIRYDNDAPRSGHHVVKSVYSGATAKAENAVTRQISAMNSDLKLEDMSVVTPKIEFADGALASFSLFPTALVQQHANVLSVRHIIPKDVNSTELCWTQFGYADDDDEMVEARLRQANLVGPAGFVSAEDGDVLRLVQNMFEASPETVQVLEMGGREPKLPSVTILNEHLLQAFYQFYRREMEL